MAAMRFRIMLVLLAIVAGARDGFTQTPQGAFLRAGESLTAADTSSQVIPAGLQQGAPPVPGGSSVDANQDSRIAALERMLWDANNASNQPEFPSVRLTGFFQADAAWFSQDSASLTAVGDVPDVVDFRRARLAATGQVAENVGYMVEFDFAFPGRPNFMDVYLDLKDLPFGTMRIGQWRQPFGMDPLTSVRELWFLERALPFAFVPFRQTGVGIFNTACDDSMTWAVSGYKFPVGPFGGNFGDSGYGMSTRITGNPVYDADSNTVVHVGFDYSVNNPSTKSLILRSTPEIGYTRGDFGLLLTAIPFFVDTGLINTSLYNLVGAEFGAAVGSLTFQAEWLGAVLDQRGGSTLQFSGGYAKMAYVLTGEHHPYNRKNGVFTRVVPDAPFGKGGCGAWEVAARWSYIDLNDDNIAGGKMNDLTFGLNWYLNKLTKMQFNYIHAFLDSPLASDADTDVYALRAQIDF